MTRGEKILFIIAGSFGAYYLYNYFVRTRLIISDTSNTTDQPLFNMSNYTSPDYRGQASLPLGLQNNNPGNIRYVASIPWQGQVGSNQGFAVFSDLQHGIRAFVINASNLIKQDGTLQAYLNQYAPSGENNTTAYIDYVSAATGIQPTDAVSLDHDTLKGLAKAQFEMENGTSAADQYISDADLESGLSLTPYSNIIS